MGRGATTQEIRRPDPRLQPRSGVIPGGRQSRRREDVGQRVWVDAVARQVRRAREAEGDAEPNAVEVRDGLADDRMIGVLVRLGQHPLLSRVVVIRPIDVMAVVGMTGKAVGVADGGGRAEAVGQHEDRQQQPHSPRRPSHGWEKPPVRRADGSINAGYPALERVVKEIQHAADWTMCTATIREAAALGVAIESLAASTITQALRELLVPTQLNPKKEARSPRVVRPGEDSAPPRRTPARLLPCGRTGFPARLPPGRGGKPVRPTPRGRTAGDGAMSGTAQTFFISYTGADRDGAEWIASDDPLHW